MPTTYDDEKTEVKPDGSHDDVGGLTKHETDAIAEMEKGFAEPEASEPESDEADALSGDGFYKKGGKGKPLKGRFSGAFRPGGKGKRNAAIGGTLGVFGALVVIVLVMLASLQIPHLAENITSWQFARTSRLFRLSLSEVDGQRLAMSTVDDSAFASMRDRYQNLRSNTWGKLDAYRPNKVYENLKTSDQLRYNTETGFLGREKVTGIVLNGETIEVNSPRWRDRVLSPIQTSRENVRFNATLDANIEAAVRNESILVRGRVANQIREEVGAKLNWWKKAGKNYRSLKKAEADRLQLREAKEQVSGGERGTGSTTAALKDTENAADDAVQEAVDDNAQADDVLKTRNPIPEVAAETIDDNLTSSLDSTATQALSVASTTFAIAMPLCIIYDGSLQKAGPTIDAENAELQRTYHSVATSSAQIKKGETTPEAVGAMGRKLGRAGKSVPQQRKSGAQPNTLEVMDSPQATSTGDFTAFDAILGGDNVASSYLNTVADTYCPVLTDWRVGVALGAGELVLGFFTGGAEPAVGKVATQGLRVAVTSYLRDLAAKTSVRQVLTRIGVETAATATATILAKLLVVSQAGLETNGLAMDDQYINQADAGGNLNANENNRQMFYGRPMNGAEVVADAAENQKYLASKESEKSTFDRYFAVSNPKSLLSQSASGVAYNFADATQLNLLPQKLLSSALSSFGNLFTVVTGGSRVAHALTSEQQNYGIVQWGFSTEEEAIISTDPSYAPLEVAKALEDSGREQEITDKYGKCFEESLGTLLAEGMIKRDTDGAIKDDAGLCAPKNLGRNNPEGFGDLVFRWRVNERYKNTIDLLDDVQNPEEDSASSSAPGDLPTDIVPVEDTVDIEGLGAGRGCHKSIADKTRKMFEAARADGVNLTGNCWRSADEQIALRQKNCPDPVNSPSGECSPPTAKPGSSLHERGLAIDFHTCSRGSTCFNWLSANAAKYGFFNYPRESWHWSVDGT